MHQRASYRLSNGKGGLPLGSTGGSREASSPEQKKPPPKAGISKTLSGSVALFPPREAFFLTK